jgi:hypothetical protein
VCREQSVGGKGWKTKPEPIQSAPVSI